jgi:hypothetical protein
LLLISLMVPTALLFIPTHRVEAQAGGIFSCAAIFGLGTSSSIGGIGASLIGATVPVTDAPTEINTSSAVWKECVDSIAYALAKVAIQALSTSIINWINSGFAGSPAFITDLDDFLNQVDIKVFEDFLGSDAIAFLCTPWQFDVRLALELQFARVTNVPECSLGDVVDNIDQFIDGDFHRGGWPGWFDLTQRNNPYDGFLAASAEADARIGAVRFRELQLLDFGRGFLSFRQCTSSPANPSTPGGVPGGTVETCEVTTPGAVIETQLEHVLGSGVRQLELADEINEIIAAFISQLVNQVITTGLSNI